MWHHYYLRQLRRARRQLKAQQRRLLTLELDGIVAVTLHTATATLTVSVERAAGAQLVGSLHEALRERRQVLQAERQQVRETQLERGANARLGSATPAGEPAPGPPPQS